MEDELKAIITRNTGAVLLQAATNEQIAEVLGRLDARMALPPPQAALSRGSVALLLLVVSLAAFAGSLMGVSAIDAERAEQQRRAEVAAARP